MNATCWNNNAKDEAEEAICKAYRALSVAKGWVTLAHIESDSKRSATDNDIDRALNSILKTAKRLDIKLD